MFCVVFVVVKFCGVKELFPWRPIDIRDVIFVGFLRQHHAFVFFPMELVYDLDGMVN